MNDLLKATQDCEQKRCTKIANDLKPENLEALEHCVRNCTTGIREVMKQQHQHCEVSRLTYAKNISKCLEIHAEGLSKQSLKDDSKVDWPKLVQCIEHNTDKIDRRFFGYYNS